MKKILIVDDEKNIRISYQSILEDNFITSTAASAEEALQKLDDTYDLVITDYDLKHVNYDGKWLAGQIKERFKDRIAVILLSGVLKGISIAEKEKLGIIDFIPKPFDVDVFSGMVTKYMK